MRKFYVAMTIAALTVISLSTLVLLGNEPVEAKILPDLDQETTNPAMCIEDPSPLEMEGVTGTIELMRVSSGVLNESSGITSARHCYHEIRCRLVATYGGNGSYWTERKCWTVTKCN